MTTERNTTGRVFVGVDGSLASLRALREAAAAARRRRADLHVVHVRRDRRPVLLPLAVAFGPVIQPQETEPNDWLDRAALNLIYRCFDDAFGAVPADLDLHLTVVIGKPHRTLASMSCRDEDLLVVGTHGGRRQRHLCRRSVSRYCAEHARCPVLVVPRDEFARTVRHRIWARVPVATQDPWRDFDATRDQARDVGVGR